MVSKALITGASSGIGAALADLLAREQIPLILCGRNQAQLEIVTKQAELHTPVAVLQGDLATRQGRAAVVATIEDELPDLVINSAGFGLYGVAIAHATAEQLALLEVNAMALTELTLEAARALIKAGKKGIVLNVSSAAGLIPMPHAAIYGASKAYVNALSRNLDAELREQGIRVLCSCPGMVNTRFRERAAKGHPQELGGGSMDATYAARRIWQQIKRRKPFTVFNWRYQVGVRLAKWLPRRFIEKRIRDNINKRHTNEMR